MTGLSPAAFVRSSLQSGYCWGFVAGLSSGNVVRDCTQPVYRRSGLARCPRAVFGWGLLQLANHGSSVANLPIRIFLRRRVQSIHHRIHVAGRSPDRIVRTTFRPAHGGRVVAGLVGASSVEGRAKAYPAANIPPAHRWSGMAGLYPTPIVRASFQPTVLDVVWRTPLLCLEFGESLNQSIVRVAWPASLQVLSFGACFNQPITQVLWPPFLQRLAFGLGFNQPITGDVWPPFLQVFLSLGDYFEQPITGVELPMSLRRLSFGRIFNQRVNGVVWPHS